MQSMAAGSQKDAQKASGSNKQAIEQASQQQWGNHHAKGQKIQYNYPDTGVAESAHSYIGSHQSKHDNTREVRWSGNRGQGYNAGDRSTGTNQSNAP